MTNGFQRVLDHIRSTAGSESEKGRLFERLMKTYLIKDPLYQDRFSHVWLWSEWTETRTDFEGGDTGIDLVAEERGGGYCAIRCKCYAPGTRMAKAHLDSFIAASARAPFTARIVVDTGDEWGPNAAKTIAPLTPACAVLRFGDLAERPFDWPDLGRAAPEALSIRHESFHLRPHQQAAFDDVTRGFEGRSGEKIRNNTEQSGTENWFVCRVALLPHCVQDRVRDASGHGTRWIVPSPHAPSRRRRTPAPLPATGAARGPVRGVGGRGGGCAAAAAGSRAVGRRGA